MIEEGAQTYSKAKEALLEIEHGQEITREHHYAIQDAKIDPISSLLFKLFDGKHPIRKSFRQRERYLEEIAQDSEH